MGSIQKANSFVLSFLKKTPFLGKNLESCAYKAIALPNPSSPSLTESMKPGRDSFIGAAVITFCLKALIIAPSVCSPFLIAL